MDGEFSNHSEGDEIEETDSDTDAEKDSGTDAEHSCTDAEVVNSSNGESEDVSEGGSADGCIEDGIIINGLVDVVNIDMKDIRREDVSRYDFADLEVAYLFYCWYGRVNGFSPRKDRVVRKKNGDILQQTFVCSREGYRGGRGGIGKVRRQIRQPRNETRCGCEANFRVHIDIPSGHWYVTIFNDLHNHELLPEKYCSLLPTHRRLKPGDIIQIENFQKVGIRPPQMYGSFANNSGGYDKIGFRFKDIYNQSQRQLRKQKSDASAAVKFLKGLCKNDRLMYVRHTVDADGRLQHLFWSDGESQMNYRVFGDVLAFDATYKKNKYMCPFVIFFGVNHHKQTIVFASALVSNETEEIYVWLLEQFMHVMNQKAPNSVITDGDLAMKNAISRVFPSSHHRLCAWHLLRNATSNVHNPDILPYLKKCMFGDYDVNKFEEIWMQMIAKFGLEDNKWLRELYDRRKMWANAHMRGNFFAGLRTTSRCEALHSHLGKFVHSRITLADFVQQFHRCLTYFRFREVEADFESDYGEAVVQTSLQSLERSASKQFTKEIMTMFREVLSKAALTRIDDTHEMSMYTIYLVSRYCGSGNVRYVSFCRSPIEAKCSCLRMESVGIPCEHIIGVLLKLDYDELPSCLVLSRWSKCAKEAIRGTYLDGSHYWDSHLIARYANLLHVCRELCELASRDDEDYNRILHLVTYELNKLRLKYCNGGHTESGVNGTDQGCNAGGVNTNVTQDVDDNLQDPPHIRTKGCGSTLAPTSGRRTTRCSTCGQAGHNKRSCVTGRKREVVTEARNEDSVNEDECGVLEHDDNENCNMVSFLLCSLINVISCSLINC